HVLDGWSGRGKQDNSRRYAFTEAWARIRSPDWEDRAAGVSAEFRADYARASDDVAMAQSVAEMKAESASFGRLWDAQSVSVREGGQRTFLHPLDGPSAYEQHTFVPAERMDYKSVVSFPGTGG
ncbi:hypothetical protein OY671_008153, partial [Metschnikowia pulcherrima]